MIIDKMRKKLQKVLHVDVFSAQFLPAFIVFLMMMVLIGLSWRTATNAIDTTQKEEVTQRASFTETNLQQRILLNENTLRAAAGLFSQPSPVETEQWRSFVNSLQLSERMPGIIGLGYIELASKSELPGIESAVKAHNPAFALKITDTSKSDYAVITMIEPSTERNIQILGADPFIDPLRIDVAAAARDSGTTAMSEPTFVLHDDGERRTSVVLYHPVYENGMPTDTIEQRRAAIKGYVYAPINTERLFARIFPDNNQNVTFTIHDIDAVNEESLLYRHIKDQPDSSYTWLREDAVSVSNQTWTMRFGAQDSIVPKTVQERPKNVLIGGTIFSLVVAAIVYLLLQRRNRVIGSKQERRIERAKDNLLSLASHQLRTPATGVKQYLGMALEGFTGDLTEEQKEILTRAYDSNERQLRIINEFLYLAKADADRIVISPRRFNLLQLVEQIVDDMHSDIMEAGHTVRVIRKTNTPMTLADVHSVRMIVENLLSNAIKYTPAGGEITLTLKRAGAKNALEVKDTGVGIDKKDFPKLFKQFSRIPNEMTRSTTGTGIGLYLAEHLARVNGGYLEVQSKRGEGSTFTAYLPNKKL